MTFAKSLPLAAAVLIAFATPGRGQDRGGPDAAFQGPPRAYFMGMGGAAFEPTFEEPTSTFAVEYGERVTRDVQAYANISYVHDLMSDRMRQYLRDTETTLRALDGAHWEFKGRDRGLSFTAGGKFLLPANLKFRPYVGGGLGVLNLRRRIVEDHLGDVSGDFYDLSGGLYDGVINAGSVSANKPLAEILVGVGGAFGRANVDIGYRYRKAFNTFEPIESGQLTFGIGMAWY